MINASELKLTAVSTDIKRVAADAVVVGVAPAAEGGNGSAPRLVDAPLPAAQAAALEASLSGLGATGAADELLRLPAPEGLKAPVLVLAGLGREGAAGGAEALRRAAGSAARQLAGLGKVVFALPAPTAEAAAAVAEGAAMGAYGFSSHRSEAPGKSPLTEAVIATAASADKSLPAALKRAAVLGRAVRAVRDLVNTAPNVLYPESFAQAAVEAARSLKLKVTVLDEKRLEKDGYGGLIGVGRGSARPPRLVKVEYAPAKAAAHVAFVGKGITFDTGGISLKPPASMFTMKSDMAGAATVLQAVLAIAELGLPVKATAWLCLAENMPSGTATRPGDVVTMFGGKTVEILNTDAEGRLVMADGLVAASAEKPDALIDVATLTGAQLIALGNRTTGIMGEDGLRDALKAAADRSGETAWPMPLPEELRPSIDSQVADLANIGERHGGMMTAAVFLREFVGEVDGTPIPWAHLDIAGPSFNEGSPYGYTPKNATGASLRTLVAYAESLAAR
ncbi:leucyl aminopeptidase [Zafaria sp. Z1313]|uniref:leucyl aminopeptidase n=1 Tax=unclassified Zafaria TaxID=2828765 RepID=UPI002E7A6AF9|nr:leucyl aminopeptidase [Zafaria sp. J156]MEE1620255.1 leucyl aminopeptidase [Zafaria sp. J156]